MIKTLRYLTLALLIVSCNSNKPDSFLDMPPLYPTPITVKLNIEEGYSINPVTGDSVYPVINSYGDTLITGKPVPAKGKVIDQEIVARAEVSQTDIPTKLPTDNIVDESPVLSKVIPIIKDSLDTFTPGIDFSPFVMVNSTGDTVPTGVPVPIKGRIGRCLYPPPVNALPPRMKETAITNLRYLDQYMGMNSSEVYSIIMDTKGSLWIGTMGGGLSRYDGNTFTHFTENEGLGSNFVRTVFEDRVGNIWIGTRGGGISKFDGRKFTHYTEKEGLSNNDILYLMQDSKGNIWIGTWGGGASKYDGQTITHYTIKEGLTYFNTDEIGVNYSTEINDNAVHSILEDSHGNFWFATIDGGVCMYDGNTFTHFREKDGLSNQLVWYMIEDRKGNLWFTTNKGVCMYNGQSFSHYLYEMGFEFDGARAVIEDYTGNLWFGTYGGISRFDGTGFTFFSEDEGLSKNLAWSFHEDNYNNLWIGTPGGGLNIYQGNSFRHFTYQYFKEDELTGAIIEDNNDSIWVNGIYYYNGEYFEDLSGNMGRNRLEMQDSHGQWWYNMASGGLSRYDGRNLTVYGEESGLIYKHINSVTEDSKGNFWITTTHNQGVCMFDGKTFTHFTEKEGLSSHQINTINADSKGNIWIGTWGGGASKYDGHCFTHYTEKEGLSANYVSYIFEDSRGLMWIGTEAGVSILDGETFTYITEKEGLSNNDIMSIVEDRFQHLWIGTRMGLNCLVYDSENTSPASVDFNPFIYTFLEQDGLNGTKFSRLHCLADTKNRLWWRTDKNLTMLDLNSFQFPTASPENLQLNRLDINGQFVDFQNLPDSVAAKMKFDSIARFYNYPLNLKLPYRQNHLTFYYSAIEWTAPHKIKYSYLIEGIDKGWSLPSSEAKADYRSIPNGTHTFKVRAIGATHQWTESLEYKFTILPPWWLRWWIYFIYGAILILITMLYRRFLLRRAALRSAVEIEKIEKEKVLELDHMKSRFFANISHEFRTPLTLILGPIEGLRKKKGKDVRIKHEELGIIHRNAKRLQQLINQILDISKLETGKVKLQVSKGNLTEFVRRIVLSFLSLAESKSIQYVHDLPEGPGPVFFDQDKLEKIITNLVSNAFKFTPSGGEIKITLKYMMAEGQEAPVSAAITIKDTGKGIPPDQLEKIFDRFYQVVSSDTRAFEGTGIGLALTKELVDIYRGNIEVSSEPGTGSIFTVKIPVSKEHFKEHEIDVTEAIESKNEEFQVDEVFADFTGQTENLEEQFIENNDEKPVILIVEDNAAVRHYISNNLSDDFQIQKAENGRIGLERAIKEVPDLVITDLMMPEMDGIELCEKIRSDQRTSHIPIVMLTARADKESKLKGLVTGADDYLIKPFEADELLVRVKNLIRSRRNLREKYQAEFVKTDPFTKDIPELDDDFLSRVVACILQNIGEHEFGVEQLAVDVGFSRSQLHRKLCSLTGYVPNKFIRNIRLKQAARMFHEGNTNITQVLYSVGFNSPSHFSQSFRELYGVNPSEYLKKM